MTNPFDLRTVVLAKHAQHVVLIHFPIALFTMGVLCDVFAQRARNPQAAAVARYNLVAAAASIPFVLLTGIAAWYWALGAPVFKGTLLLHLVAGLLAGTVVAATGWLHWRKQSTLPLWRLPVELAGLALIGLTAHLGGFLSGVNV